MKKARENRTRKPAAGKSRSGKPEPRLPWQTGPYSRHAEFHFVLPYQFLLLCRLLDCTPAQLLTDFMDSLSGGSRNPRGRESLIDYFIHHGYGQHHYTTEDIRSIFRELDAISLLWPEGANSTLTSLHTQWRDHYHPWWFEKWFQKTRRKQ